MNLLECVELIEETKENSKNALIEKGVELDDSYKLSQVDEKIAEIKSGGGSKFPFTIDSVTLGGKEIKDNDDSLSCYFSSGINIKVKITSLNKDGKIYPFFLYCVDGRDAIAQTTYIDTTDSKEIDIKIDKYEGGEYSVFVLFVINSKYDQCQLVRRFKVFNDDYY